MRTTVPDVVSEALDPEWLNCTRCLLAEHRLNVVQYRGMSRPRIVFLGEAPGKDEDRLGIPFIGRSGQLAEQMIAEATEHLTVELRYGFLNTVGCVPYEDPTQKLSKPVRPPRPEELTACQPRLVKLLSVLKPKGLVFLGKTASSKRKQLAPFLPDNLLELQHPAYVARQGGRMSVAGARFVSDLKNWLGIFRALQ